MTTWLNTSFQMQFRVIDGLTVRYARSEDGGQDALLLSPWPESLLAFVPVWPWLAANTRLVAIDLPGFGHSQRCDALMSPQAMAGFVLRAADAFGLGGGAAAVPLQLGGVLKDWVEAPDLEELRRADPGRLVTDALSGMGPEALADPIREDYLAAYQGNRMAESMRYVRSYPAELPVLAGLLPRIDTPVQIIAGSRDTAVPLVNAEFLHQRLPHSRLDVIDAGHFAWEDAPDQYAALVTSWWAGGSQARAPRE